MPPWLSRWTRRATPTLPATPNRLISRSRPARRRRKSAVWSARLALALSVTGSWRSSTPPDPPFSFQPIGAAPRPTWLIQSLSIPPATHMWPVARRPPISPSPGPPFRRRTPARPPTPTLPIRRAMPSSASSLRSALVIWSTYVGRITLRWRLTRSRSMAAGNVYVAGVTESSDFPKSGASIPTCRVTGGPFVAELDTAGAKLIHSTGMSGLGYDNALALAVSSTGDGLSRGRNGVAGLFRHAWRRANHIHRRCRVVSGLCGGHRFQRAARDLRRVRSKCRQFRGRQFGVISAGNRCPRGNRQHIRKQSGTRAHGDVRRNALAGALRRSQSDQRRRALRHQLHFDTDDRPIRRTVLRTYRHAGGRGRSRHLHAR